VWSWGEGGGDDSWTRFPSIEAVAESRGRQTPLSGGGGGERATSRWPKAGADVGERWGWRGRRSKAGAGRRR
jgi:hypothetical protein